MEPNEKYMRRCLELALQGKGSVEPNPLVGAVLVFKDRIIGEGYHKQFGGPHAEVNCIDSVIDSDRSLIADSVLYVSLEPCAHFGKTPPCADLIIANGLRKVVIGCRDPFPEVNGKGQEKLLASGIEVISSILEKECRELNAPFFTYHEQHRPFIILKWAETANKKIAATSSGERLLISNDMTNRMVHKWRGEVMSILVGRRTALRDNPSLNTRLWPGRDPVRLVIDPDLNLPQDLKLFDGSIPTIVFNYHRNSIEDLRQEWKSKAVHYYQVTHDTQMPLQISNALYQMGIQSVLVEGGAMLLQSFIDIDLWDEARVITNSSLTVEEGLSSPVLEHHELVHTSHNTADIIATYKNISTLIAH